MTERALTWEEIERMGRMVETLPNGAWKRQFGAALAALEAGEAALVELKEDHDISVLDGHSPDRCDCCKLFAGWREHVAPRAVRP